MRLWIGKSEKSSYSVLASCCGRYRSLFQIGGMKVSMVAVKCQKGKHFLLYKLLEDPCIAFWHLQHGSLNRHIISGDSQSISDSQHFQPLNCSDVCSHIEYIFLIFSGSSGFLNGAINYPFTRVLYNYDECTPCTVLGTESDSIYQYSSVTHCSRIMVESAIQSNTVSVLMMEQAIIMVFSNSCLTAFFYLPFPFSVILSFFEWLHINQCS